MRQLFKRVATAILILAVVVGVTFLPFWAFRAMLTLAMLMVAWEYQRLFTGFVARQQRINLIVLLLIGFSISDFISMRWLWTIATFWWLVMVPIGLVLYNKSVTRAANVDANASSESGVDAFSKRRPMAWLDQTWVATTAGVMMMVACFSAINDMCGYLDLRSVLLIMLPISIIADSAAYVVGRLVGRHKLAKNISPGKTVEGAIGGLLAVLAWVFYSKDWILRALGTSGLHLYTASLYWAAIAVVATIASILGDLLESALKRRAGVKDSGHWLPGHGGFYDRLDSLLAVAPVLALGILLGRI